MLGAYGNSWIHTEHFDHLASESFLFDQAYIQSTRLDQIYRACWGGLAGILRASGWNTALVCDEPQVMALPGAVDFAEHVAVDAPAPVNSASDVSETGLARLFTSVADWLEEPPEPFCLWVHSRGMSGEWDAPLALRNQYADEEDPTPPEFVAPPNYRLRPDYDPDELLGIVHAYAGQVSLFDSCLGALVDHLHETSLAKRTLLAVMSARGFPLGEHLRAGPCDEPLFNEINQLAWLMRFPDGLGALDRSQALVQPADLPATILDVLGLDPSQLSAGRRRSLLPVVRGDVALIRDRIAIISQDDRALRTPGWLLRLPNGGEGELYAKPSDRWEVNEVAKLCPDIVAGLQAALAETEQLGEDGELPPLADELATEVD
jgi:arylsulfatase A-like enzyme